MSREGLCILTGLTPIIIKLREVVSAYRVAGANILMDTVIPFKEWPHPADTVIINSSHESKVYTVQAYTCLLYTSRCV